MNNEPGHAGLWIFRGIRHTTRSGGIVSVCDVVEVRPVKWRRDGELAAFFIGKQQPYPLSAFEGTWKPLRIDFGGERHS